MNNDLISRERLKNTILLGNYDTQSKILSAIDNAPTVDTFTFDDMKKGINVGYKAGRLSEKWERPQGEWEDYSVTFYKCPECGYLLPKYCPDCQHKVILPKGGAE